VSDPKLLMKASADAPCGLVASQAAIDVNTRTQSAPAERSGTTDRSEILRIR
jgi:hypothetical protein